MENKNTVSSGLLSLILISVLHGINHFFYNMLGPLYLSIKNFFGFSSISKVSLLGTIFLAFYGSFHLIFGFLSDKIKKVFLISIGTLLAGISFIFIGFIDNYSLILITIAWAGIMAAVYHPAATSLITIAFKKKMGFALGISSIGATLGLCCAPALSGWIAKYFSWRESFKVVGIISILFAIFFFLKVKEPKKNSPSEQKTNNIWNINRIIWLFIVSGIMIFREFCGWGSFFLIPLYAQMVLNYDSYGAGLMSSLGIIGGFISGPLGGYLSDRYGRQKILWILLILISIFFFYIPFNHGRQIFLIIFFFGFFYAASVPVLDALIGQKAPDAIKGSIFGITMTAGIGFGSLSPWILAKIIDSYSSNIILGFKIAFGVLSCSIIIAMIFLAIYGLNKKLVR